MLGLPYVYAVLTSATFVVGVETWFQLSACIPSTSAFFHSGSLWVSIEKKQGARSTSRLQLNDQALLNQALEEMNVEWTKVPYCESYLGVTKAGLKVVALGRKCSFRQYNGQKLEQMDDLNVIHPMLGHNTQSKINALHRHGLWAVKGDPFLSLNNDQSDMHSSDWLDIVCSSHD